MKSRLLGFVLGMIACLSGCGGGLAEAHAQVPYALMPLPRIQFFDGNGIVLSGGLLYTYLAGTTTPSATYQDSAGVTPNANPIVLNASGYPSNGSAIVGIYFASHSYKIALYDQNNVLQWTADNVYDAAQLLELALATSITTGTLTANIVHITGPGSYCGNSASSSNGVIIACDNTWINPDVTTTSVETRGISVVNRRVQTNYPEGGADQFGAVFAVTMEPGTTSGTIAGEMIADRAEVYLRHPTVGSYVVNNAVGVHSTFPSLGANATATNWYAFYASDVCRSPGGTANGCIAGGDFGGHVVNGYQYYAEGVTYPQATGLRASIKTPALGLDGSHAFFKGTLQENEDVFGIYYGGWTDGPFSIGLVRAGTVNTSGLAVQYVSGDPFVTGTTWNGRTIIINAVNYTIASVTDSDDIVLTSNAPALSNVAYSVPDVAQLRLPFQYVSPQIQGTQQGVLYTTPSTAHSPLVSTVMYCDSGPQPSGPGNCVDVLAGGGGGGGTGWPIGTNATTGNYNNLGVGPYYIGLKNGGAFGFVTDSLEAMRITTSQQVLIGAVSGGPGTLFVENDGSGNAINVNSMSGSTIIGFQNSGSVIGQIISTASNFNVDSVTAVPLILKTNNVAAVTIDTNQNVTLSGTGSTGLTLNETGHPLITLKASGTTIGTLGDRGTSNNVSLHNSVSGADITLFASVNAASINAPWGFGPSTVSGLPAASGFVGGYSLYATDGAPGTSPCSGSGGGALALVNQAASEWDCIPLSTATPVRGVGYVFDGGGSSLSTGTSAPFTVPFACTLQSWNIDVDTGTATVKLWKRATGTAIPTSGNSINTSGVSISSGTAVHSTTLSDFTTTTFSANDIYIVQLSAVSGATQVGVTYGCQ